MRAFILLSLTALACAYPDVSHLYNGLPPSHQMGFHQSNGHILQPHNRLQLPDLHSHTNFAAPQMVYLPPKPMMPVSLEKLITPVPPTELGPTIASPSLSQTLPPPAPRQVEEQQSPLQDQSQPQLSQHHRQHHHDQEHHEHHDLPAHDDSYQTAYQHSTNAQEEGGYPKGPEEVTVHKHIYVHVPPKDFDEEEAPARVRYQGGPKQKHYKVVFIKAPSPPSTRAPVVPPPPQNEEKTLIYVLHKKPERPADIVIPTSAPTKPSKPEVYFIKYKTRKEEAPVYGPPPAGSNANVEPRHTDQAEQDLVAPVEGSADLGAPLTTVQPLATEEPQLADFMSDLPSDVYGAPTMPSFSDDQSAAPQPTVPSQQYLPPQSPMQPIVVEDMPAATRLPSLSYGPPSKRYFLKKKK